MKMKICRSIFFLAILMISCEQNDSSNLMVQPTSGKGGSMARFALAQNFLYVVDNVHIHVYELDQTGATEFVRTIAVGFGVETIFVRGQDLFLGANDAMYTYSIVDPAMPTFVSRYSHIMACDPVVVNNHFAYVTLRVRESCRAAGEDALEVIDISDKEFPKLIKTYAVQSPHGLGVDGQTLFVCEGDHGLKIFNAENPMSLVLLKHYENIHAFDVIPNDGVLILTGKDGIFQYDYSNLSNIDLLSHISVQ